MSKLAKTNKTGQFNRSGVVHYRVDERQDGGTMVMLTVDFERAPTPEHTYVADFVEVSRADSDVLIVFGKIDFPGQKSLRNKVEIYFPFRPFVYQLWRSSRVLHQQIQDSAVERAIAAKDCSAISSQAEKVQTLVANNALIVITGGQCMFDFFLIAAKDLWLKTRKGDPLNMDALVRVYSSEPILLRFLDRCDAIAQELIRDLDLTDLEDIDENVESIELR
jgi:hypothetical protein